MIALMIFFNRYSHLRGEDTFICYTCLENILQAGLLDKCFCEGFPVFFYSPSLIYHHRPLTIEQGKGLGH